jgi:4-hydroxy-3-methylbut-2-enyl diphosphate reductase
MSELEKTIETIEAEAPAEVVAETTEPVAEETVAETVAVEAEAAAEPVQEAVEETGDNFEQAFEKTVKRIRPGQVITGTVLQVVDGEVFVNIGYKSDGVVPKNEFAADPEVKPEDVVKEGDTIDVEVIKVNDGEGNVLLSRKNVEGKKIWDELLSEESVGKVFEATGKEVVKGGLVTDIMGVRAFVPASHISTKYVEKLDGYVGKTFKVKVLEVDKQRKRMVASAKQVLLDEAAAEKAAKWDALVVGEKVHGVVRRITDFGAFVDIGGIDGLVHVTDCAWGRVKHPSDALSIGQEIEVLILNVDKEKERVSLGYKQLQPKPWTKAAEKYPIGSIVEGKVVRIVPFGAFVALEPTIDGLIHISQVAVKRVEKVEDELKVGDIVRCKVLEVNVEAKRISLSRKEAILEENPEVAEQLAAEKAERERLYQERRAQREQQNKDRQERQERRSQENSERQTSRPDRRRRNSEDGDYELPPVQQTTTSLADLFANFKAERED